MAPAPVTAPAPVPAPVPPPAAPSSSASEGGGVEVIELDGVAYMALKRKVVECGVPKKEVADVLTKAGLKELAEKHGCALRFV